MNEAAHGHAPMTVPDYLAFADSHPRQSFELLAGVPVAMAPATIRHGTIAGNIEASLRRQVRDRGCRTHSNAGVAPDEQSDFLVQPDVMVRCGPVDDRRRWVDDPVVVLEVLSPSTMADDRGYKLKTYQARFPSLRHIVLVYQDEIRLEHWQRAENGAWSEGPDVLSRVDSALVLPAVDATVLLAEVYEDVFD